MTSAIYDARTGQLEQIPKKYITLESMLVKDQFGITTLHWAAWFGELNRVPKEFLTLETLLIKSNAGNIPLTWASHNDI